MIAMTRAEKPVIKHRGVGPEAVLLVSVMILAIFGLLVVCDTSYQSNLGSGNPFKDAVHQFEGLMLGLIGMTAVMVTGYTRLRKAAPIAMGIAITLLVLVLVPHVGVQHNFAYRWLRLHSFEFQPSEFAKYIVIVFLAATLSRSPNAVLHPDKQIFTSLACTLACVFFIKIEPDLGTAIVVFLTILTILVMAGARPAHLLALVGLCGLIYMAHGGMKEGQKDRIRVYKAQGELDDDAGYQTHHSMLAVGSGRITGVGWGQGKQKYYLPEANTDFIFATVAEELGFLGSIGVLTCYLAVTWSAFRIAKRTVDPFGRLLAVGVCAVLTSQAIINMAVVTLSIPATGVPLPLISYGSSSLVVTLTGIGILLSVANDPEGKRGLKQPRRKIEDDL